MGVSCDMSKGCDSDVSMLDDGGYVYCERHGLLRRQWTRCRKLRPAEIKRIGRGLTIARY